ncbi:MAG TPA: hypothetical protein PLL77_05460 [Pyrinomonadaceae bacterium]|nr:hypothetical protein [Pyrinomonadaceae bacterium]
MLKLYKFTDDAKRYWETWDNDNGSHTVHWGVLGEKGESKVVQKSFFSKPEKVIQAEIDGLLAEGYAPIDEDEQIILLIEYVVDGFGTPEDLDKRHSLEDRMNEVLGWTGLGMCDGGSIGSGTMEVCCFVVDFEIAKKVIAADLEGSEFADYSRIYDEGEDV